MFNLAIQQAQKQIFLLDQSRLKFDSMQTLPWHKKNISIVFTVLSFCCVWLTGSHKKSPRWAYKLWKIHALQVFKTWLINFNYTSCGMNAGKMSGLFDMFIWQYTKLANIWSGPNVARVDIGWNVRHVWLWLYGYNWIRSQKLTFHFHQATLRQDQMMTLRWM